MRRLKHALRGVLSSVSNAVWQSLSYACNLIIKSMDRIENFEVNSPRWLSLEDFEGEIWKDIPGYEERYQVSNMGRVRTKDRSKSWVDYRGFLFRHNYKSHILKAQDNGHGYLTVLLNERNKYLHRLVGLCFIPNPQNKPDIDHIDTNRHNNVALNLRWVTKSENCRNIITYARSKICQSIPIVALDYFGNYVCEYYGSQDAADKLGVASSVIKDIVHGNKPAKLFNNLQFIRKSEYDKEKNYSMLLRKSRNSKDILPTLRSIVILEKNGNIANVYPNTIIASSFYSITHYGIARRCKKHTYIDGFTWYYLKDLPESKKEEVIKLFLKKYNID